MTDKKRIPAEAFPQYINEIAACFEANGWTWTWSDDAGCCAPYVPNAQDISATIERLTEACMGRVAEQSRRKPENRFARAGSGRIQVDLYYEETDGQMHRQVFIDMTDEAA